MADLENNASDTGTDDRTGERAESRTGLFSRLRRAVTAPFRLSPAQTPHRAAAFGSNSTTSTVREEGPERPASATPKMMGFEAYEANQARLRQQLREKLAVPAGVTMESLENAQASGKAVFGSTAHRRKAQQNARLSDGAALHPKRLNAGAEQGRAADHPNRRARIPGVPAIPDEFRSLRNSPSLSSLSSSALGWAGGSDAASVETAITEPDAPAREPPAGAQQARAVEVGRVTNAKVVDIGKGRAARASSPEQEGQKAQRSRPAYRDSLGEEKHERPQLDRRPRFYGR